MSNGLKKSFNELLSDSQRASAQKLVSLINKKSIPDIQRAGKEQYTFKDHIKNPYNDVYTDNDGIETTIQTDGIYSERRIASGDGEVGVFYSIKDYNYILITHNDPKKLMQTVITMERPYKMYVQSLLGLPVG